MTVLQRRDPRHDVLAALLGLEEHARLAGTAAELAFVMVNDTRSLLRYRQAALHTDGRGVVAVSGVSRVEKDAPFTHWLVRLFRRLSSPEPRAAGPDALDGQDREDWAEWLPAEAVLLPITGPDGARFGTLLLARDDPWTESEIALLVRAAAIYGFAWSARHRPSRSKHWRSRLRRLPGWRLWLTLAAIALLFLPVRLSVLAPAEVVARDPAVMRAPLDGVVERILVRPNQVVARNQPLFDLERTSLLGRLEVARKGLSTAQAELDQATQQAFTDPRAKAQLAIVKARVAERSAEAVQLEDLLQRSHILSPRAGVAVLDDPSEWLGRPVSVGEKVMAVADPTDVEVEAWLAPADVIDLSPGAPVVLFLNTDPLSPVAAELLYVAYEATLQPDGLLAYRVRARIVEDKRSPRLGLKGTARLDGRSVPLAYWLLRRPMAVIRSMLGT